MGTVTRTLNTGGPPRISAPAAPPGGAGMPALPARALGVLEVVLRTLEGPLEHAGAVDQRLRRPDLPREVVLGVGEAGERVGIVLGGTGGRREAVDRVRVDVDGGEQEDGGRALGLVVGGDEDAIELLAVDLVGADAVKGAGDSHGVSLARHPPSPHAPPRDR